MNLRIHGGAHVRASVQSRTRPNGSTMFVNHSVSGTSGIRYDAGTCTTGPNPGSTSVINDRPCTLPVNGMGTPGPHGAFSLIHALPGYVNTRSPDWGSL